MVDGTPMASPNPAPRLGDHTAQILQEIGEG
jgi:crotonobetainyl-CoA:carnitine CoA-transferase CaiB-like acyl-CoA transferase